VSDQVENLALARRESQHFSAASAFVLLKSQVEALLFVAEAPLEAGEIRSCLGEVSLCDIRAALRALAAEYQDRAFELVEYGNKYQIRTKNEHLQFIKKQYAKKARSLSKNALEILAIIAYRQPITRAQINALRQVDSSSLLQTLKEKELVYASGIRKEVGHPIEYKTTQKFLEVFGLSSLSQLPRLRSLQMNLDDQKKAMQVLNSVEENRLTQTSTAQDIGYDDQNS
jgi:segregation and condensation protein B